MATGKKRKRSRDETLRCVAYARVSTTEQAETGASLDAQIHAIGAYAAQRGYEVVDEYRELGASGTSDRRPAFQRMMESVLGSTPEVEADAILVFQTSRFMRDVYKARFWKRRLEKHGLRVIAVQQDVGDGPQGQLMEGVFEGRARLMASPASG